LFFLQKKTKNQNPLSQPPFFCGRGIELKTRFRNGFRFFRAKFFIFNDLHILLF
jgi:hypothetical protein